MMIISGTYRLAKAKSCLLMQRTDDVQEGPVHFIHLWEKKIIFICATYGLWQEGPALFHTFMG